MWDDHSHQLPNIKFISKNNRASIRSNESNEDISGLFYIKDKPGEGSLINSERVQV